MGFKGWGTARGNFYFLKHKTSYWRFLFSRTNSSLVRFHATFDCVVDVTHLLLFVLSIAQRVAVVLKALSSFTATCLKRFTAWHGSPLCLKIITLI